MTNDESYSAYVKRGNDTIVTVTPNEGYELKSMTVNDEEKFSDVKDGVLTISNILTDIDVVATFKKLTFKITTTASEGGTVVPSSEIIEWGDDATVTVTPNEGYELSTLTVDGNDKISELKDGVLTISAVKANVNVEATFKKLTFKITTKASEGGTVVPSSEIIEWGDDATVTVTPNENYKLNTLTVNGNDKIGELKDGVLTINAVKADVNVEATFVTNESIKISSAKQVTYMSDKDLDFTGYPDLKAYVATGYDKSSGTIWLTRVKEVPANTGFLLMGEADTYEIPVKTGGSNSYYQNMFKGTIEGTTIQTTDGDNTNYYLSNGDAGVGFYKVQGSVELKPNRAYLSVPTEIPAVGAAGSTETIKVSAAGQVPYYNSQSLDFTSLDAQGVKAYTATGYDYNSGTIWLTRVKQVPAETGILIMAPQGEYPVPTASVASVYANMFKGTLTGTTIQTHETIAGEDYINYYLSSGDAGVGFYKVTKEGGVTIGANRCYLPIKNKEAAGTRSISSEKSFFALEEADEVIGIPLLRGIGGDEDGTTNLTPALSKGEGEWYTLQGQRVAKPGKGLYIRNGKKVVIK